MQARLDLDRLHSNRSDVGCLFAFWPLYYLEADCLAFLEAAKAGAGDGGEMHKDIFAAVFWRDESETFGVIEPLYGAVAHVQPRMLIVWVCHAPPGIIPLNISLERQVVCAG